MVFLVGDCLSLGGTYLGSWSYNPWLEGRFQESASLSKSGESE